MNNKVSVEEKAETLKNLEEALYLLSREQPFCAYFLQGLGRQVSRQYPTAWVMMKKNRFDLGLNPDFFNPLLKKERVAILQHEVFHLVYEHLNRLKRTNKKMKVWNVAADICVNQSIKNLPMVDREETKKSILKENPKLTEEEADKLLPKADKDGKCATALFPENYNLPNGQTTDFYYDAIMNDKDLKEKFDKKGISLSDLSKEDIEDLKEKIKNGEVQVVLTPDDHSEWENEDSNDQMMDEELKQLIKDAADKTEKHAGNIPSNIKALIDEILRTKTNWRQQLQSFLQHATKAIPVYSRKRPSRRYGLLYPGTKYHPRLNLGFLIDTSGSMSEEELGLAIPELNKIYDTGYADITVIEGDAKAQRVYTFDKKFTKNDIDFWGRGGTDPNPWFEKADELKLDAVVVLTDVDFYSKVDVPKVKVLWALSRDRDPEEFTKEVGFGKAIVIRKETD